MHCTESNESRYNYEKFLFNPVVNSVYLTSVTPNEINSIIVNLQNKSTSDTKVSVLKIANEDEKFMTIMTNIINSSFEQGIFPQQLKLAKVVPIHKNGSKTEVSNYRPISLLSPFSKVIEKAIHCRIVNFMESNNSLYELQYGFRKGRSCEHK